MLTFFWNALIFQVKKYIVIIPLIEIIRKVMFFLIGASILN
jgi:hypothetical protein